MLGDAGSAGGLGGRLGCTWWIETGVGEADPSMMEELMSGHQGLLSLYWSQRPGQRPVRSGQDPRARTASFQLLLCSL